MISRTPDFFVGVGTPKIGFLAVFSAISTISKNIWNKNCSTLNFLDCEETKGRNPQNPNFLGNPKN